MRGDRKEKVKKGKNEFLSKHITKTKGDVRGSYLTVRLDFVKEGTASENWPRPQEELTLSTFK